MNTSFFDISLAQWSLHRMHRSGVLAPLDFPAFAKDRCHIDAIELVSIVLEHSATDRDFIREMQRRCADADVQCLLIMVDREGELGNPDPDARRGAVERHMRWLEAAAQLGCHSIRVNAKSVGSEDEQRKLVADGVRALCELAEPLNVNVLFENHGGHSSDAQWLLSVVEMIDHPRCGTLPDFGNFCLDWSRRDDPGVWLDRYEGVSAMMPFARAVSAKSNAFDAAGNETATDYLRMMRIVAEAGYRGFVGIEYEGDDPDELAGVLKTKTLLERVRRTLAAELAQPA